MYMKTNFPRLNIEKGDILVDGQWLRNFWNAAQKNMLSSAVEQMRAICPVPLEVIENGADLLRMRVWLDDVRPMPKEGFDIWVKTAEEALDLIETGQVSFMSFDHDLGFNMKTMKCDHAKSGYDVAKRVEQLAAEKKLRRFGWAVHSMNPTGANNIEMALKSADRFWDSNESSAAK
jgi:hypothetical protein